MRASQRIGDAHECMPLTTDTRALRRGTAPARGFQPVRNLRNLLLRALTFLSSSG